jgi:hypothetical protein
VVFPFEEVVQRDGRRQIQLRVEPVYEDLLQDQDDGCAVEVLHRVPPRFSRLGGYNIFYNY